MKRIFIRLILIFSLFLLSACKPDDLDIDIYTSDIEAALRGEIIEIPINVSFSILGEDKENLLPQAVEVAKQYLSKDSEFSQSKGDFGEHLVIKTKIPIGKLDKLESHLNDNPYPAVISVTPGNEQNHHTLELFTTKTTSELDKQLNKINYALGVKLPANRTNFNIISDSKVKINVYAYAVFVLKKPNLFLRKELNKRDSIKITFTGGDGSVYSEIAPILYIDYSK